MTPEFWFATSNKGKLSEVRQLIDKEFLGAKLFSIADLPVFSAPPENGKTFLDNARIKARSLHALKPDAWVMGEDSGLEVEGLGGMPGVFSARYAGDKAQDSENVAKVLKMVQLRTPLNRKAQFHCCLVVIPPRSLNLEPEWIFTGEMKGSIGKLPTGRLGFGYDPIFIADGETQTLAELGPGFKNKVSHRAVAVKAFLQKLKSSL